MDMIMALNSYFQEDQNRPKDHSNWIRESVFMKESPHMHIWTRSALKKIGHPWKPINKIYIKIIWTSPSILFSSKLIVSHRWEARMTKNVCKESEITRFEAHICFRVFVLQLQPHHIRWLVSIKGVEKTCNNSHNLFMHATRKFDSYLTEQWSWL